MNITQGTVELIRQQQMLTKRKVKFELENEIYIIGLDQLKSVFYDHENRTCFGCSIDLNEFTIEKMIAHLTSNDCKLNQWISPVDNCTVSNSTDPQCIKSSIEQMYTDICGPIVEKEEHISTTDFEDQYEGSTSQESIDVEYRDDCKSKANLTSNLIDESTYQWYQPIELIKKRKLSKRMKYCISVFRKLIKGQMSYLYLSADVRLLILPSYSSVIENPIDLETIRTRINNREYSRAEQLIADVRLMFRNFRIYHSTSSEIVKLSKKLEDTFERKISKMPDESSDDESNEQVIVNAKKELTRIQDHLRTLGEQIAALKQDLDSRIQNHRIT